MLTMQLSWNDAWQPFPPKKQKNTGAFFQHELTSIPAWISNDLSCEVWGEITYPLANLNGAAVEVWELINL